MPSTNAEEKAELRAWIQAESAFRSPAARRVSDAALHARFLALPQVRLARTLLLFWGVGTEPDTLPLIDELLAQGKRVALPRCLPHRGMEARLIRGREGLVPGAFRIPEPGEDCPVAARDEIDVILVPNLCCDREGYRLGHGGGYYDRYLAGYRGFTVAFCPRFLLLDRVPRDERDVPVRLVLTD